MIDQPLFYLIGVPAVLLYGISKGGFGGGFGIIAVPLLAIVVPATVAAAVILPILCVMDLVGMRVYWGKWDWGLLKLMIPPSFIGIAIGALSFQYLEETHIRLMLGGISMVFALNYWLRPAMARSTEPVQPSVIKGGFWSTTAGFTSFISHAGGPPAAMFLLPLNLDKTRFQATTVLFFTVVNQVKLLPYGLIGQFEGTTVLSSLFLLPVALIGMYLGVYLHHRISQEWFMRVCYVLLFFTGLKLLTDGLG